MSPAAVGGAAPRRGAAAGEWLDRHSRLLFITPAVIIVLAFSIFPLVISAWLALTRFRFVAGGFEFRFVGLANFERLLFGSEQWRFLGRIAPWTPADVILTLAMIVLLGWWLLRQLRRGPAWIPGLLGRLLLAALVGALGVLVIRTTGAGGQLGSLTQTLFYVAVGCAFQFVLGLGLALLCSASLRGRAFFRVVFFLPLMVTPVGIAYMFRMLADMSKGPFAPLWQAAGLGEFAWASDPWAARLVVVVGDTWQWVPFVFIVMLAALESQPREQIEAAELDGAGPWQIFRDITWPAIAPVAATVVLIRVIEAFKIVDLPNVLTNGGPGTATESMTLHSFMLWRTLDLGGSAAVAYLLLFVTVVLCVSVFNLVVLPQREARR